MYQTRINSVMIAYLYLIYILSVSDIYRIQPHGKLSIRASWLLVVSPARNNLIIMYSVIFSRFLFQKIFAYELYSYHPCNFLSSSQSVRKMIQQYKKEGKIVSSEVTIKLLWNAMQNSENRKFVIDGFPRNEENRAAFENIIQLEPDFVLFFDCPEEELIKRLLNRNQGRVDDNINTIIKRLRVYFDSTLPVIDYYSSRGKVYKIDANRSVEEVFYEVKNVISKYYSGKQGEKIFTQI
ncbi:UMP-CMP kinase 3-like isoform X1 [Ananas comosus]|uniref:adenylate kinase n=1 Tax=Ananas comosus TaxID=4615 RepID=A0A6P5F500_ANACO|nr:UMP-CMP kinase 3-like isoform X1 [Ananas comosus]